MNRRPKRTRLHSLLIVAFLTVALGTVWAQRRGGRFGGGDYYDLPPRDIFPGNTFTFCRIQYTSSYGGGGYGRRGGGWETDYPESDMNFSRRLAELTTIKVNTTTDGRINHAIVQLTEPDLFHYPFIYMLEVGAMELTEPEQAGLRDYLLRGGFLLVDDFWGDYAWDNLVYELGRVLPPEEYPIVDLPLTHEIFHIVFDIKEVPQIPSVNNYGYWRQTGITYETGHDYRDEEDAKPHCRGIFDKRGRLMVVLMHNSDLGDGWEREGVSVGYFEDFSRKKAYPMGINIVCYAMTH